MPTLVEQLTDGFARLAVQTELDAKTVPCLRLDLRGGGAFDVYRADRVSADAVIWRVRGFLERGDAEPKEQRALVMGTVDGRAMVNFGDAVGLDAMADNAIVSARAMTRPIEDLSAVMANAVRALFREPDD